MAAPGGILWISPLGRPHKRVTSPGFAGSITVVLLFNYNVKEIEKWHFWGVRDRFFLKKGV
jgi:hypothetical protein